MNELEKVVSDEDQKEKYIDVMLDHFVTTGGVFKDGQAISDEEMEAIYSVAYNLYESGKYDDAFQVYGFSVIGSS